MIILHLNEVFTSIEGEGPEVGTPTLFIRFAGCDLKCPFCDTKQSWDLANGKKVLLGNFLKDIHLLLEENRNIHRISITGGNPFMNKSALYSLVSQLVLIEQVKEINLEHPGLFSTCNSTIADERKFLSGLKVQGVNNSTRIHINMDIKFPLWEKTKESMKQCIETHRNILIGSNGFLFRTPSGYSTANSFFTGNYKVVIGSLQEMYYFLQLEKDLVKGIDKEPNFSFYLTLVRQNNNEIDAGLRDFAFSALEKEGLVASWRVNANMHILWNIK